MEYIVNNKLRTEAYLKFLLFFVITVFIVISAVYFDVRIPSKDNDILREKITTYENQVFNQQQFITAAQSAKSLIDSMNKLGQYNALLDREIAKQLEIMRAPGNQNNSFYTTMNKDVFNVLYDYNELNKKFIGSKDVTQQVEKLRNELSQCDAKRAEAERDLDIYRNSSLGVGQAENVR
jgi:hypothetical protein